MLKIAHNAVVLYTELQQDVATFRPSNTELTVSGGGHSIAAVRDVAGGAASARKTLSADDHQSTDGDDDDAGMNPVVASVGDEVIPLSDVATKWVRSWFLFLNFF